MARVLTIPAEVDEDGDLRVDLPADAPRGPVLVTIHAPEPTANRSNTSAITPEAVRRGFDSWFDGLEPDEAPLSIQELRALSRSQDLEAGEVSRDVIAARDE